ncbi:MAG TPA: hypothetical protein VF595_15785 [Tepidisphaeraceae bacterium]|jgi:hypothetical protein
MASQDPIAANSRGPVQIGPASPLFAISSILAIIFGTLALFNVMKDSVSPLLAIIGILCGLVGLLELFALRQRGVVSIFTIVAGLIGIGEGIWRLMGHGIGD